MKKHLLSGIATLLLTATASFAGTSAVGSNTVSPTLAVNANIHSAVVLTLSTGTLLTSHCAISAGAGTDYQMSFGNVDGLGVEAGSCNMFAPTTQGSTPAIYYTDYTLTPAWAGSTATSAASITAYAATLEAGAYVAVPTTTDLSTAPTAATTWAQVGTTSGAATPVVSGTVLSAANQDGKALTRFLALEVAPTAASNATATTTVTFTMTIQ